MRVNLKGGPNGPTLGSQSQDLCALKHKEPHLLEPIARLWKQWGYIFDENQYATVDHGGSCPFSASKLMAIQDRSCKTRVVAMIDSYSQVSLRPFHRAITFVLRNLKRDYTEDQQGGVRYLQKLKGELYSIDLSNATDTLPVDLGLRLLERVIPHSEI